LLQLPPPVHGAAAINTAIATSKTLAARFDVETIPLRFADGLFNIGGFAAKKLARAASVAARLTDALRRRRPDLVYLPITLNGGTFYRDAVYVAIVRAFGVPLVVHCHARRHPSRVSKRTRAIQRAILRNALVVQLSPELINDISDIAPSDRIRFVANGVPDIQRHGLRTDGERAHIVFLSNMRADKGPLLLLDALKQLADRGRLFEATFAGAGFGDGFLDVFRQRIEDYKLAGAVRYVGGVTADERDDLLANASVFAFPTYNDAFPLVVLEAMRSGVPVVASHEGAIPDMVVDGVTGYVVPRLDSSILADRLERLVCSPELRREMGACGRARYEATFTSEHFVERLSAVWTESLEAPHTIRRRRSQ